jgi:acyl-CoA hydrolase
MVNCAWKHSMEVGVRVEGEDPLTGVRTHTASAYLTFVALEDGKPTNVPELLPQSPKEQQRQQEADERRSRRLAWRKKR